MEQKHKTEPTKTFENKSDEHNFEQLATSSIYKVSLNGSKEKWLDDAMYRTISSPDGNYVMVSQIKTILILSNIWKIPVADRHL